MAPLRWELKQQHPGYSVKQHNKIAMLGEGGGGGWSRDEVDMAMRKLFGQRGREILRQISEECDFQLSQHI